MTAVTFPSGLTVTGLGDESRCMRLPSGPRVDGERREEDLRRLRRGQPITSDDTVSSAVSFINVHYFAAAGSLYGREAEAAYEYADPTKAALPVDPVTGLRRARPTTASSRTSPRRTCASSATISTR